MKELVKLPGARSWVCIAGVTEVHAYKGDNEKYRSTIRWADKSWLNSEATPDTVAAFINEKRKEATQ
jgi:hypothetical protein